MSHALHAGALPGEPPPGRGSGDAAASDTLRVGWSQALRDRAAFEHALGAWLRALLPELVRPEELAGRVLTAVDDAIGLLHTPESLVRHCAVLARSAADCGIATPQHDRLVAALLRALEAQLGEAFDTSAQEAWLSQSLLVCALMRRAGSARPTSPPPGLTP